MPMCKSVPLNKKQVCTIKKKNEKKNRKGKKKTGSGL